VALHDLVCFAVFASMEGIAFFRMILKKASFPSHGRAYAVS